MPFVERPIYIFILKNYTPNTINTYNRNFKLNVESNIFIT